MKSLNVILFTVVASVLLFNACEANQTSEQGDATATTAMADSHNSMNSLDWNGVYTGTVPCADCEGIKTVLQLNKDKTYKLETMYQGKSEEIFTNTGSFSWNEEGSKITLEDNGQMYQVGENVLFHLDKSGERITGELAENYQLTKAGKPALVNTRWKLIEIRGQKVAEMELTRAPYIELTGEADGWRVSGNDGCNQMMGTYEMGDAGTISFGNMAGTMMACMKADLSKEMTEAFSQVDNYTMSEDGMNLSLNKAKMAPLMRFEADYMSE